MPKSAPFEEHTDRYEAWFETHKPAYRSELAALDALVPPSGRGLEIGVGTGRFAAPLGLNVGVDPAREMLEYAADRGLEVCGGVAESLPFARHTFETAVMVTTICFVDDLARTLAEARRVLRADGALVLGYIDVESPVGDRYRAKQAENPFYEEAEFVSTEELLGALDTAGFGDPQVVQTIFEWPGDMDEPHGFEDGYGDGAFVGIKATPD